MLVNVALGMFVLSCGSFADKFFSVPLWSQIVIPMLFIFGIGMVIWVDYKVLFNVKEWSDLLGSV